MGLTEPQSDPAYLEHLRQLQLLKDQKYLTLDDRDREDTRSMMEGVFTNEVQQNQTKFQIMAEKMREQKCTRVSFTSDYYISAKR